MDKKVKTTPEVAPEVKEAEERADKVKEEALKVLSLWKWFQ